jgi:hypothetical protein
MAKKKADRLKADFRYFMIMLWREMGLPDPTPMQQLFGNILQHDKSRQLVLLGFRGFAKTLISAAYTLWRLYCDPHKKVAFWGSSAGSAEDTTKLMLDWVKNISWLQHLAPTGDMKQSATEFDVKGRGLFRGASVEAYGIEGRITGTRADIIVVDDPETSSNGASLAKRVTIDRALDEATAVMTVGGEIKVLGTVHFDDSLYVRLLGKGYKVVIFPIAVPSAETQKQCWDHYPEPVRQKIMELDNGTPGSAEGEPLDRFSKADMDTRRATGLLYFERQYLCNPFRSSLGKKPLDMKKIIVFDADHEKLPIKFHRTTDERFLATNAMEYSSAQRVDKLFRPESWSEELNPYDRKILYVDPAGGGKDETAVTVCGAAGGYAVCFASVGLLGGSTDENLGKIIQLARQFKVNNIYVESNFGQDMFSQLLRAFYFREYGRFGPKDGMIPIIGHRVSGKKELRMMATLDPIVNFGRLIITPNALEMDYISAQDHQSEETPCYRLSYQMSYFSEGGNKLEHDDRLDSLASNLELLSPWLNTHPADRAESWEDRIIAKAFAAEPILMGETPIVQSRVGKPMRKTWKRR